MSLSLVPAGKNLPDEINVIIEIPANADPIKYEVDKDSGTVWVDRFMSTPMFYPCNYGFRKPHFVIRWRPSRRVSAYAISISARCSDPLPSSCRVKNGRRSW